VEKLLLVGFAEQHAPTRKEGIVTEEKRRVWGLCSLLQSCSCCWSPGAWALQPLLLTFRSGYYQGRRDWHFSKDALNLEVGSLSKNKLK